jgi:protein-tyrosine-phosphatase
MAEGFMKFIGSDLFEVYSAGTEAYPKPKPMAIEVMEDIGIDMSSSSSKLLDKIPDELDILITMGCGVECPYIPTVHREDWALDDPSGGPKSDFIETRDIIRDKVLDLIKRVSSNQL